MGDGRDAPTRALSAYMPILPRAASPPYADEYRRVTDDDSGRDDAGRRSILR